MARIGPSTTGERTMKELKENLPLFLSMFLVFLFMLFVNLSEASANYCSPPEQSMYEHCEFNMEDQGKSYSECMNRNRQKMNEYNEELEEYYRCLRNQF